MMKPALKKYVNDQLLQEDIRKLLQKGIYKKDIYILAFDDERTNRIAEYVDVNTIGIKEMKFGEAFGALFEKKEDELMTKIQQMSFSEAEARSLVDDLAEGKVLLIVQDIESIDACLI